MNCVIPRAAASVCEKGEVENQTQARRRRLIRAFTMFINSLTLVSAYASEAASEIPVHFKRGAYVAQVNGRLTSMNDEVSYLVAAKAGQHMKIKIDAPGAVRGLVTFPGGDSRGEPGDMVFDDVLPKSGNYHIHLRESPMGEEWQGRFTLTIEIH